MVHGPGTQGVHTSTLDHEKGYLCTVPCTLHLKGVPPHSRPRPVPVPMRGVGSYFLVCVGASRRAKPGLGAARGAGAPTNIGPWCSFHNTSSLVSNPGPQGFKGAGPTADRKSAQPPSPGSWPPIGTARHPARVAPAVGPVGSRRNRHVVGCRPWPRRAARNSHVGVGLVLGFVVVAGVGLRPVQH